MKVEDGYFLYVYTDPETGVVRYVGSGLYTRMVQHTHPSTLNRYNSPFYVWLRTWKNIEWNHYRFRVMQFVTREEAIAWENALILEHFDTTLNVRAADNGKELRPMRRPDREPYGPRTPGGFKRLAMRSRREKFGVVGSRVRPGRGVYRDGNLWRASVHLGGKIITKRFKLYCDALKFIEEMEKSYLTQNC